MDHVLFLVKERLRLSRCGDIDLRVHFGLFEFECRVEEQDLCTLHGFGHARVRTFLVNDHAFDKVCIVHCTADFLLHIDVPDIHLAIRIGDERDRLHDDVAEPVLRYFCIFAGQCGLCDLFEHRGIGWLYRNGEPIEHHERLRGSHPVAFRDNSRVDALGKEPLRVL